MVEPMGAAVYRRYQIVITISGHEKAPSLGGQLAGLGALCRVLRQLQIVGQPVEGRQDHARQVLNAGRIAEVLRIE